MVLGFPAEILVRRTHYISRISELTLAGSDFKRKLDLFLAPSDVSKHKGKYHWADVLVMGEPERSEYEGSAEGLLIFCGAK